MMTKHPHRLSRRIAATGLSLALTAAGMVVATAPAEAARSMNMSWKSPRQPHCVKPVDPAVWESFDPCPARFTPNYQIKIIGGYDPIQISPGFDNQFHTSLPDGQPLAVFLDGGFAGWTTPYDGGLVMVQPETERSVKGKQRIRFYNTNSQLVGWGWVIVNWGW